MIFLPKIIIEGIADGIFSVDVERRVTSMNGAAERIAGLLYEEAIGRQCSEVFRFNICGDDCALERCLSTGKPVTGVRAFLTNLDGSRVPIGVTAAVLSDEDGHVIGGAEIFCNLSESERLSSKLEGVFQAGDLSSLNPLMQRLFASLPLIAVSPSSVLIFGETGTGKERVAQAIHSLSPRSRGPFVTVNCGAMPDTLLESELFGYKRGAFTGAYKDKPGRFSLARGGTLFLDEIGEMSQAMQVRLLRVLQEHAYEPLGAIRPEKSDVRLVCATNKDLMELTRNGTFREDLYYRVNVVRLDLPPLRMRGEDIPLLVAQFIESFNCVQHKSILGITADALLELMTYHWPGNVRELQNVVERCFIGCNERYIGLKHLPEDLRRQFASADAVSNMGSRRKSFDVQEIRAALERNGFNRLMTARALGIHKTTLFRKMKRLGMYFPQPDGRTK